MNGYLIGIASLQSGSAPSQVPQNATQSQVELDVTRMSTFEAFLQANDDEVWDLRKPEVHLAGSIFPNTEKAHVAHLIHAPNYNIWVVCNLLDSLILLM